MDCIPEVSASHREVLRQPRQRRGHEEAALYLPSICAFQNRRHAENPGTRDARPMPRQRTEKELAALLGGS